MNFLTSLLGGGGGAHDGTITADLKRLNSVRAGLGDQAIAYVRTGAEPTVLASLTTLCKANELEVCRQYIDYKTQVTRNRRKLFAQGDPDFDLMQRYNEVLCAAASAIPAKAAVKYAPECVSGTAHVPREVRIFLSEAFMGLLDQHGSWHIPPKITTKGLVPERAIEMTKRLGGSIVDFFDALFVTDNLYYNGGELYRRCASVQDVIQANPDAFKAAMKRMPASARASAIENLGKWDFAKTDAFIEFIVQQAGEGGKAVREAASTALHGAPSETIAPLAIAILKGGDADQRAGMVDLLARTGSPEALAALKAHRDGEKTARIVAAIDNALSLDERKQSGGADAVDDTTGYLAIDGSRVEIPPLRTLADGDVSDLFGQQDREHLNALVDKQNDEIRRQNEAAPKGHYKAPQINNGWVDKAVEMFRNGGRGATPTARNQFTHYLGWMAASWTRAAFAKLPPASALRVAIKMTGSAAFCFHDYAQGPGIEQIQAFINGPDGDVRHIQQLDIEANSVVEFGDWRQRTSRPAGKGDLLRSTLQDAYATPTLMRVPRPALWPYLAENLEVFDEALGLRAPGDVKLDRAAAVRALALLPATPARYYAPLLEIATGENKNGRAEARAMMTAAPEVESRLIALLDDSRQAIRAGAADWLSLRRDPNAVPALHKRLKKEKSEVARAAILSGLKRLGEDLSDILGPEALIAEAEKGLKSAKFDKLEWMSLDKVAQLRFRNGDRVPSDVVRWWVFSAFKLKQPGGNALFEIYLDQLEPKDAEAFSTWVLDSWVSYDTAKPNESDANAHAKAGAKARQQMYVRWQPDYTEEQAFAQLKSEFMSHYLHSGADSKGVLALATRAPPGLAAERARAYLKAHGARTSQASSLLEMLAGKGDAVSLQVVIAAATRLKQKGVQKFAGELVNKVAEARDWTMDELADRTVPTAGFDEDGLLTLVCGEDGKVYEARVTPTLEVVLRNPAGKEVASLPSGADEATAASKKQLGATKKELKQIISMQSARLYEALCAERSWSADDWRRSFHDHPVMRRLVERVVWLGLDGEGNVIGAFRPTAEGDFTNTDDASVDIATFERVRIAHGALLSDEQGKAWAQHLEDYEIKPLFIQFGRDLLRAGDDAAKQTRIEDRKGWVTDAFTIRGIATKLGYERGSSLDGGFFNEYRKPFSSAGLAAVIEFTGNSLPEQNIPAALTLLRFERATGPGTYSGVVTLGDVPPVLLSECWNDYHAMAAKAKYDPEWEKKASW